jgi:alkylation response protein AidB-like acyl-CoA dehydrogenase
VSGPRVLPADAARVADRLRALAHEGAFDLPLPAGGRTVERFDALRAFGYEDLAVGRLAEAHLDGIAIKAEAGRPHDHGVLLGVWAAGGPRNRVVAEPFVRGGWRLTGRRSWCSGASLLDRALLTVEADGDALLVDVDLTDPALVIDEASWRTPALAATATATVTFAGVHVPADGVVGEPGFYLGRPGFWAGSVGVAAIWAGGAERVAATLRASVEEDDPHALAHLGAVEVTCWTMRAALAAAAAELDADPCDERGQAMTRAFMVRHLVERSCLEVVDRSARALGPAPMVADASHAQRLIDLQLYVRQIHAEQDLEDIGRARRGEDER